jgi:hypothetical protein
LGQGSDTPQRLDDLMTREIQFRRVLATGDRVKASEYVLASKRKDFLNKPTTSLQDVKIIGVDFADKDHVHVRITGQTVVATGSGAQLSEPHADDVWVREKGAWFYQPDAGSSSYAGMFIKAPGADAAALAEIKSSFKLLTTSVDIGELWQGDHKDVPVQFDYSGLVAIKIASKTDTPVSMIDTSSNQFITKDSKQFTVIAGSDDFDGPFDVPVNFTVYYKSVALDQSVRLKGTIRPMFKYHQEPATVPADSQQEFRLFLKNNTDEAADLASIETEGKFFIMNSPHHLAAGEEVVISLKRDMAAKTPGTSLMVLLKNEIRGKQSSTVLIH